MACGIWCNYFRGMAETRIRRVFRAPRPVVYRALIDAEKIARWKFPDGMSIRVHSFDGREGGTFRISLTYAAPDARGKSSDRTDTYHGRYLRLVPDSLVVEVDSFETDDPAFQGEMTLTLALSDAPQGGTLLEAVHAGLPPGISSADNETGWRMALDKLAGLVEAGG